MNTMVLFLLNLAADIFILVNLWAYFPQLWEPWFAPLFLLPGALFSHWWAGKNGVWWVDAAVQVLWPVSLRAILFLGGELFMGPELSPLDPWFFWFDKHFWPLIPLTASLSLAHGLVVRRPGFSPWRVLIQGIVLFALFFPQGQFQNSTYSHPLLKALALAGFLGLEMVLLYFSGRGEKSVVPAEGESAALTPPARRTWKEKTRTWAPLTLLLLPLLAALMLFLLGRYEQASVAAGGGLMKPDLFRFDFSQFITLESEISMSDDLVMLYRREGTPTQQYVRRFLLSGYSPEKGFFVSPPGPGSDEDVPPVGTRILELPYPDQPERKEATQEYYIVNFDPSSLLALNAPVKVIPYEKWDQSSFVGSYKVISRIPSREAWELLGTEGQTLPSPLRDHYTRFQGNPAIANLAAQVTATSPTYFDKVWDILFYLKTNYYYSLKPGVATDGNQLEHFLFEAKKGYCSYFAFAMALMLRSQGIPARVAVGFFIDPNETMLNFYPVRANQAHAWVEAWFDGVGWMEFDPTSEDLAPGEEFNPPRGLEVEEFARLIQEILNHTLREVDQEEVGPGEGPAWYESVRDTAVRHWPWLLGAVYGLLLALVQGRRIFGRGRWSRDPRRRIRCTYLRGLDLHRLSGRFRLVHQTPQDFARHLRDDRWSRLTDLYLQALYAEDCSLDQAQEALELLSQGQKDWLKPVHPALRILHTFLPWTLFTGGRHGIR